MGGMHFVTATVLNFQLTFFFFIFFLGMLKRKILVLDLDETLIHSHHDGVLRQTVKPGTPPDFVLKVSVLFTIVVCCSMT